MPSVKNQDKRDTLGINEMLMRIRQKLNSVIFFILKNKWAVAGTNWQWLGFEIFRGKESSFSLDFWPFGPLVLNGARSKFDLCGEGYAWIPIWWSSDNSKKLGSFPTCVILWLRAM